jgi:hypothetical protein
MDLEIIEPKCIFFKIIIKLVAKCFQIVLSDWKNIILNNSKFWEPTIFYRVASNFTQRIEFEFGNRKAVKCLVSR